MKQCPACKNAYDDNTMFCKECGVALGNVINSVQMAPGAAYVTPAPAANAVPMNEHKEWGFSTSWGGSGFKVTNIVANGPIMEVEQYKQYVFKFGKQRATIDAREITDVHVKKKFSAVSIMMILGGLATLASSDSLIWGIVLVVVGAITIKTKYYVITHRRGSVNIPSDAVDGSEGQEFLDYITKYSPYAVKTDLSLGR